MEPYSTLCGSLDGRGVCRRMDACTHMAESLCCSSETVTTLLIGYCLLGKLCPTVCDPTDWSLPGSSVHGISQARIMEWVAMPFSRGSSQPRVPCPPPGNLPDSGMEPRFPASSALAGRFFTTEPPGKPFLSQNRDQSPF